MTDAEGARARLRALLPGESVDDALADALLEGAEETLRALTGRSALPAGMAYLAARLAVARYNLMGLEGETERREGSMAVRTADIPDAVRQEIRAWRVARVAG